ncbi:MAG: ABC transporter permease [Synergistales bacterium]|nr:ABC transporter permease [Synergistales bacterium]
MRISIPVSVGIFLLLLWEMGCRAWAVPVYILPPPSEVLCTALSQYRILAYHGSVTLFEILAGLALAIAVSIPMASAMFLFPWVERALAPFLVASQAIPVFALAPVLVVWFGYGIESKVIMATVIIFFPLTVNLLEGFKSCDRRHVELFRMMGYSKYGTLKKLFWPWALPYFFAGLKVAVSVATIGAVIGEWVGAQRGLGYLMIQSNARLKTDMVFAAILWLSAIGLVLWWLAGVMSRRYAPWKDRG